MLVAGASIALVLPIGALAQTPQRGGFLSYVVESEPDTFDCHASATSQALSTLAPHYSTLLKFDIPNYPKIVGDVAESWSVSPDNLSYTFRLRPNVKFHDGSILNSDDIKVTFNRIRNPETGFVSARQSRYASIASIEIAGPLTVVFRLKEPSPAFLGLMANPWNCIYSAKKLVEDPKFYETHILGTGPFVPGEYVKGSHWTTRRFDDYFRAGLPYLDGTRAVYLRGAGVVNALAGGQVDATFFQVSPADRDAIKAARGDRVVFQDATLNVVNLLTINTRKPPFDDVRVRRAIHLAIDRRAGEAALSKLTVLRGYGLMMRPGSEMALSTDEIEKLPGFGPNMEANRAEAKRLLAEAGVTTLQLKLLNRPIRHPWESLGIFVVDQLRQVGIAAEITPAETPQYFSQLTSGNFDIAVDFNNSVTDDPTEVLAKYVPGTALNYTGADDRILVDLYDRQSKSVDPQRRKALVGDFQRRMVDQLTIVPMFWSFRSVVLPANLRGWTIPPSTVMGMDLAEVWLQK
jgi:peptide/nickel transport system substrate-binding protein